MCIISHEFNQCRTLHRSNFPYYTHALTVLATVHTCLRALATQVAPYFRRTRTRPFWSSRPSRPVGRIPARGLSRRHSRSLPRQDNPDLVAVRTKTRGSPLPQVRDSTDTSPMWECVDRIATTEHACLIRQQNPRVHNVAIPWPSRESYRSFVGSRFAFFPSFTSPFCVHAYSIVPNLAV